MNKIIAVDFDGTIHDNAHPVPGRKMGPPLPGAQAGLDALGEQGYTLIIFTLMAITPSGTRAVEDWLEYYGFCYDQITSIKPNAEFFIDDRAIRHISWDDTLTQIAAYTSGLLP